MLLTPSSSKTIDSAISDTATSAIDELHFLMLFNTSILLPPGNLSRLLQLRHYSIVVPSITLLHKDCVVTSI